VVKKGEQTDVRTDGNPHYYICEPVAADKKIKVTLVTNNITIRREEIIHEHMMTSSLLSHGDMESECIGDSSLLKDK